MGVNGISSEQCHQHENHCRKGRQDAGGFERDGRLITERAEVIDPGQAHDPEPETLMSVLRLRRRNFERTGHTRNLSLRWHCPKGQSYWPDGPAAMFSRAVFAIYPTMTRGRRSGSG